MHGKSNLQTTFNSIPVYVFISSQNLYKSATKHCRTMKDRPRRHSSTTLPFPLQHLLNVTTVNRMNRLCLLRPTAVLHISYLFGMSCVYLCWPSRLTPLWLHLYTQLGFLGHTLSFELLCPALCHLLTYPSSVWSGAADLMLNAGWTLLWTRHCVNI